MSTSAELLQLGLECHRAGDLDRAATLYRELLALDSQNGEALHLLGVIAHQQGRHAEGVQSIRAAIELTPGRADFYANLAEAHRALGQFADAEDSCRHALELQPHHASALNNLALALLAQRKLDEAVAACLAGLQGHADSVELWNNLGEVYRLVGRLRDAEQCFRRVLQLKPRFPPALLNLGNVLHDARRLLDAERYLLEALQLRPGYAKAHSNLCSIYLDQHRLDLAEEQGTQALMLDPQLAEAHSNLSAVRHQQGRLDDALELAETAIRLAPSLPEGYNNLASTLQDRGCAADAVEMFRSALATRDGATRADLHSNLLFAMQYVPGITPETLCAAHRQWDQQHAARWAPGTPPSRRRAGENRSLRVGLVSADLGSHPVGQFVSAWLEHVDRERLEIICYSDRPVTDDLSAQLRAAAAGWCDARGMSDEVLADQIRSDRIDILCDLAGHTRGNRLLVFARRPAPVQVTWTGYVGTTGLSAMDYLIADAQVIPAAEEANYSERVLRLPDGWLCHAPPPDAPEPVAPPCLARRQITFGCFNNSSKITSEVIRVWSEVLRRVPDSRLLLKFKWFDDAGTREHFSRQFVQHGIDASRLELRGWSSQREHLACYREIDLALDTFPYTGGITTCEALWMGVPVVSLLGRTFAARQSFSHLTTVGLGDTIAPDIDRYIDRAVDWASDRERLAKLRGELRERMRVSPLCDGPRFAHNLISLLERAWSGEFPDDR